MNASEVWQWVNANGSGLQAAGTILTAVIAIWALRSAALDSRDRSRPVVLAQFRVAENSHSVIDLVVSNVGLSPARDVTVTFDPPIVIPEGADDRLTKYLIARYRSPIQLLAPGQELSNIWYSAVDLGGDDLENVEPTPDAVTVKVRYRGRGRRRYADEFPLHVDIARLTTYSTSTDSFLGRVHGIHKSLVSVSASAERLAKAADYYRRDEIAEDLARLTERAARHKARESQREADNHQGDSA